MGGRGPQHGDSGLSLCSIHDSPYSPKYLEVGNSREFDRKVPRIGYLADAHINTHRVLCPTDAPRRWVGQGVEEILLPKFEYYLDESDPDVLVLRRQDDSFVAAFSAEGVSKEGIIEAAKEDYRTLLEAHAGSLRLATEQEQSA
jgi:hypothetical protein